MIWKTHFTDRLAVNQEAIKRCVCLFTRIAVVSDNGMTVFHQPFGLFASEKFESRSFCLATLAQNGYPCQLSSIAFR
jgi:hypothetical protein